MTPLSSAWWRLAALLSVFVLLLAACDGVDDADVSTEDTDDAGAEEADTDDAGAEEAAGNQGGTLRVRFGGDIAGFDPAMLFQIENQTVAQNIYNGLLRYNEETNEIIEDLASSYEVSDDGLTYTFELREGVAFHDDFGDLTADDVVFSFERIMDPDTGSRYASEVANIAEVTALDDLTVEFTLESPNANFLHTVSAFNQGFIVSQAAVEERGDDFALNPVGTGPFAFDSYTPGDTVLLVAHEDYFEGRPALDAVEFRIIAEETTAEVALSNGEVDAFFAMSSPEVVQRLEEDEEITVHRRTASFVNNLILNTQEEPLDDVRVRQAMAHAINREAIQEDFFQGLRGPADTWLTEAFMEYNDDVTAYPYDPDHARELLDEAGVESFDFEITAPALAPYSEQVVLIQDDLNAVGINTTLNIVERAEYGAVRAEGNIESSITSIVGPPNPDGPLQQLFHSAAAPPGMNLGAYVAVDEMLAEAQQTLDEDERISAYHEVQEQLAQDLPAIPLYSYQLVTATGPAVQGYVQNSYYTFYAYPISLQE